VAGSSKAEEWGGGGGVVQEGDVVEAVRVGRGSGGGGAAAALELEAPFKGGRAGLHKALHAAFKRGDTSVEVRVRGGRELQACIVPHHGSPGGGGGGGRKQYVLRSLHDPNYLLGFVDRLESECLVLQGNQARPAMSVHHSEQLLLHCCSASSWKRGAPRSCPFSLIFWFESCALTGGCGPRPSVEAGAETSRSTVRSSVERERPQRDDKDSGRGRVAMLR
jgi:hypothetical protein